MKCKQCNGDGWYADHSESHYRNGNNPDDCYKYGCPIQVQCADCLGTGEIKEETTDGQEGETEQKDARGCAV